MVNVDTVWTENPLWTLNGAETVFEYKPVVLKDRCSTLLFSSKWGISSINNLFYFKGAANNYSFQGCHFVFESGGDVKALMKKTFSLTVSADLIYYPFKNNCVIYSELLVLRYSFVIFHTRICSVWFQLQLLMESKAFVLICYLTFLVTTVFFTPFLRN